MTEKQQKEIYNKWKELEKECHVEAQIGIPGKPYKVHTIDPNKIMELSKYRRWVVAYCLDLLDIGDKYDVQTRVDNNQITCKCNTSDCAKCLLLNCKDNDCYYHPIKKKEDFRLRYKNR